MLSLPADEPHRILGTGYLSISIPTSGAVVGRIRQTTIVTMIGNRILSSFDNRTELFHLDLPLFFCGQKLHNRRLDNRHQRHVGICCYCDRSQQLRSVPAFLQRKIEVGPSAPPMMEIAAAALSLKPIAIAPKYAAKIPNCAAAPSRKLFGFAISGPKSVIAPTPMKIRDGRIAHSSSL